MANLTNEHNRRRLSNTYSKEVSNLNDSVIHFHYLKLVLLIDGSKPLERPHQ